MSRPTAAERHVRWTIGTHDHDLAGLDVPRQMEEHAERRRVRPLQIVQKEEERLLFAESLDEGRVLLKDAMLLGRRLAIRLNHVVEPVHPSHPMRHRLAERTRDLGPGHKEPHEFGRYLEQDLGCPCQYCLSGRAFARCAKELCVSLGGALG